AWRESSASHGHEIIESVAAIAEPAGITVRKVYEDLRNRILRDLQAAMPIDTVLLYLHGAMVAEGYDDCEGDLLQRVRAIVGDRAVVGAELDLHAHLTGTMTSAANVIILYKEYPHVDIVDRAHDLYRLCTLAAAGVITPVSAVYDCRTNGLFPTTREPLRSLVDDMFSREGNDVLSLSLVHGFPYGDVAGAGAKVLAIADHDRELALRVATEFGERFCTIRDDAQLSATPFEEAIDLALAEPHGRVVMADVADNAGGGAPGDSTFILRRLLQRGATDVVSGTYYDPVAVDLCFEAGLGASFTLRIGGKLGPSSGMPVDAEVTVCGLSERHTQDAMDDSGIVPLGRSAWVRVGSIELVLCSIRSQVFAPTVFTNLGIDLCAAKLIVVKSTHHFYGKFAPLASRVLYASSPGALSTDFETIPYEKRDLDYWPRNRTSQGSRLIRAQ
ncbi:MAG: M81 family metallopeptidase, partial [Candidatus Eremiobacteraeota bacterium]|nr:M81 family metallopeptidase [Candidatus Eremiobacteraeota bacterium]